MPYLLKYSLKRIALLIFTTFIILTVTFFLVKLLPDPAISGNTESQVAFCREQVSLGYYCYFFSPQPNLGKTIINPYTDPEGQTWYFYRSPLVQQYAVWLTNIFTKWEWGVSSNIQPETDAIVIIAERLPATVLVNVFALIFSIPLGFLFGIIAALNKNKPVDHAISTIVMIFISVPSFVIISLLILVFGSMTHLLPLMWPSSANPSAGAIASAMVIPVLSLMFGTIATFTRYTRAELCEVMSSEFLLLARTKGLSRFQCVTKHALRNSLVPIVPMIIGQFVGIMSGSMVLEQLYSIPGIGNLFVQAITLQDYNVLMVDMAVFTMIGLFANLFVDLSYGLVDPRIRMGAKAA